MEIDVNKITNSKEFVGKKVWICDYRQPDLDKKPIRHVKPTEVMVFSNEDLPANKRVYYSENHFRKLSAKGVPSSTIIGVFDNTGYRSFTGVALKIFDNKEDCIEEYKKMADVILLDVDNRMATVLKSLQQYKDEVLNNKINCLE